MKLISLFAITVPVQANKASQREEIKFNIQTSKNGLFKYSEMEDVEMITKYFKEGHAIDDSSPGLTPLFYASIMNKPKSVKVLLELGADYFIRNDYTISPLYAACQRNNAEVVKVFSDFGLDLHHWRFHAKNGMTPFLEGCKEGSPELLQPFLDHKNIDEDLIWACIQKASDPAVLKVLRKKLQELEEHDEL